MTNRFAPGLLLGILLTPTILALGAYVGVRAGVMPANADARPGKLETWAAKTSLRATLAREAPRQDNPVALNDANLVAGIKLYKQNCAVCHGGATGDPSNIAKGLYQRAPQLGKDGVEDDPDGVTYWKITHGIRLTGMPAFSKTLTDEQRWQITLLLKHMDALPPKAGAAWKTVR